MATFLLTWNPTKWPWNDLITDVRQFHQQGFLDGRWSCGNTRQIQPGDRLFLLRQGLAPRGLCAAGRATSTVFRDAHWSRSDSAAKTVTGYIDLRFDALRDADAEPIFLREWLNLGDLGQMHWDTKISGIRIPEPVAQALEREWAEFLATSTIAR